MIKNLLYQEWKLVALPVVYVFMSFCLMLLIPGYPYTVNFFYTCLALFMSVQTARENRDVLYMAMLPIAKKDIVKARYLFMLSAELLQILLCVPVALVRGTVLPYENPVGIEPNVAFFALAFLLFAAFNAVFLGSYFRDVHKVGTAFLKATAAAFLVILAGEASVHVARAVSGACFWDSMRAPDLLRQLPFLAVSLLAFAGVTALRYRADVRNFIAQDL